MTDRPSEVPAQQQEWPGSEAHLEPSADHGESSWTGRGRLHGKRAVITGGDSGIGRAVAVTFAKEGADLFITHLPQERADAAETARVVGRIGQRIFTHEGDLRTAQANQAVAQRAIEQLGGVDILVCNAAFQMSHDELAQFPPEQIERTFTTNVFAPFWLVQALESQLENGGCVLVTTSIQAYSPSDHLLDYAATKAALNNLVVNLAQDLGARGTRVNAVAPGPIWTPLIPATMPAERVEGFGSDTPLGRPGQPVEVAAAFVFLASDEASYVSGTVVGVTGGKPVF